MIYVYILNSKEVHFYKIHKKQNPTVLKYLSCCISNQSNTGQKQKQKYRGMFETQKSGNKTSSGEIGLNIRTFASPKVVQDQVPGGVIVLCWHAVPVANVLCKHLAIR